MPWRALGGRFRDLEPRADLTDAMNPEDSREHPGPEPPSDQHAEDSGNLWPGPDYERQVEALRAAIGQTVYLAELDATEVQLGVRFTDRPYTLLAIVDFPRPDPTTGLAPHLIVLDDGRGVNLGRIARISVGRAFNPSPAEILFLDRTTSQTLLFQDRQLSREQIARRSKQVLGEILGSRVAPAEARLTGQTPGLEPPENDRTDSA